jgi:hypothetical protein
VRWVVATFRSGPIRPAWASASGVEDHTRRDDCRCPGGDDVPAGSSTARSWPEPPVLPAGADGVAPDCSAPAGVVDSCWTNGPCS